MTGTGTEQDTDMPMTPDPVEEILRTVRALVECESPSADRAAIARSADLVSALGEALLGEAPERFAIDGVTHLRWRFGAETRVLLLAHHDTVWPLGTLERIPFAVEEGTISGPGSFDMKVGLAMAMHAIAELDDRDGIALLVTGDEEVGSVTSRALIEETARGARAALVLEASADGGALKIGRKGATAYEILITGCAAHAGLEPERGVNASIELAHQMLAVTALADPERGTTATVTVAASGSTANTVPARASFTVDVRATSSAEQQRVDTDMRALRPVLPGAAIEVRRGDHRPPLERSASAGLFARASAIAAELGQDGLAGVDVGGASDGNFTAGIGTPTLDGLGAVGGGAHAEHEHALVAEIVPRTRLLGALAAAILADPEPEDR